MRHFISYLLITLFMFSFTHEAYAKRFGGGKSFGGYRSQQSASSPTAAGKAKNAAQQNTTPKRGFLGGMLGGLLVGGLLASLLMSNGLGAGLLSWLILGSLAFFLIQFFRKRMQPHLQAIPAQLRPQHNLHNVTSLYPQTASVAHHDMSASNCSARFEQEPFLRAVKVLFIRLQSAYDQKNMQDIAEFTAPDVFAEIKMQLDERGAEPNVTEVISFEAKLLNVAEQANEISASVRFTGQIKENNESNELDEVWHFRQYANNNNWIVAGIEQSAVSELV